ncbi:MAG: hypothetical protein GY790_04030 [Bacteroidetes bacterium]|nr:hypothetical protein [Bacteroidota bacterium]
MSYSKDAERLREMIEKAIEDSKITHLELDMIHSIAAEDGHVDRHEQALLDQLHQMIEDKSVKLFG